MIYDCFTFYNELDILEMRLEELYPVVDRFVIVEMNRTFQGDQKGSVLYSNLSRFIKYSGKMNLQLVECPNQINNPWEREYFQRNAIGDKLHQLNLNDDDVIILGDADEIPRRSTVESLNPQPVQSMAFLWKYSRSQGLLI